MKLRIKKIADAGTLEKERIVIDVTATTDIGIYAIFQVDTDRGRITSDVKDAFWFPDQKVFAGDIVVIYTKRGRQKSRPNDEGGMVHFFYWDKDQIKWHGNFAPVLLSISDWEAYTTSEADATFSVEVK